MFLMSLSILPFIIGIVFFVIGLLIRTIRSGDFKKDAKNISYKKSSNDDFSMQDGTDIFGR